MKLAITVTTVLVVLARYSDGLECACQKYSDTVQCFYLELESDKSFHFNESIYSFESNKCENPFGLSAFTDVDIISANGSIGYHTFQMLPELERLQMSGGNFEHIEDTAFCSQPNLRELHIDCMQYPALSFQLLSNCEYLRTLDLRTYELKVEPYAFKNMSNLEELSIAPLQISHLKKEYFEPLVNLKSLKIYAQIEKIDHGVICSPPKLEILHITLDNVSQSLTQSMLENCQHIKELLIEQVTFNDGEKSIEGDAFSSFTNINTVILRKVRYPHLKKRHLAGLSNVEKLRITSGMVFTIDSDVFVGFNNLKYLDLGLNDLTAFNTNIIKVLPYLNSLDLTKNKLESINTIAHPVLENLVVSENPITNIDVNSIKTILPNLKKLEIGCTQIPTKDRRALKEVIFVIAEDCNPRLSDVASICW